MNILFLAPQPFFEVRGTPINVRLVVTALSELGYSVDLLVFPHGEDAEIPNVNIYRVKNPFGLPKAPIGVSKVKVVYDKFMMFQAFWMLLRNRYDAIHAVEEAGFIAWFLSKIFKIPYVFDMDSHITDQLRYSKFIKWNWIINLVEKIESKTLRSSSKVITVCKALSDVALRYVPAEKIAQIEDIPQQFPAPPEGLTNDSIRTEFSIPSDAPLIVYTGNLESYQGIDLVMESAPVVIKSFPSVKLLIVGGSGQKLDNYRVRAALEGIGDNLIFAGARPLSHMPVFLNAADILLSPRLDGTNTPLKIYTYLATGKPIVATNLLTHTQLLTPDVSVLAAPEKVAYAEALLLLLGDEKLRLKIGEAGRTMVDEQYNYQVFKNKIEKVYDEIANNIS